MAGIQESETIDLVAQAADGRYLLVMVETRPWGTDPAQPNQLKAKIKTYAQYALDGGLLSHFPQVASQAIVIRLDCSERPDDEIAQSQLEPPNDSRGLTSSSPSTSTLSCGPLRHPAANLQSFTAARIRPIAHRFPGSPPASVDALIRHRRCTRESAIRTAVYRWLLQELEDVDERQVERDDHDTNEAAEHHDHEGLNDAGNAGNPGFDFVFEDLCVLGEQRIQ